MNLRRVWVQCIKELVEFRRDRLAVGLAFGLPVAMLLIFGFAIRLQIKDIPIAVQDFDRSAFSREFVARVGDTQELTAFAAPLDRSPAAILDGGDVRAVVVIPPGTQRALSAGRPAPLQGLVDASDVVNATTIKEVLTATSSFVASEYAAQPTVPLVRMAARTWFNPGGNEALFIVPGVWGSILSIFGTLLAAITMVRDKERGTIVQAYASRLTAAELIAGKCLALEFVGLVEAVLIVTISIAIWGLRIVGDPLPLLIGTPLLVCAQVLFGLLIGAATNTVTSAIQAAGSVNSLMSLTLSGYLYPIFTMPPILQWLSLAVPARHYINLSRDAFVRGSGWSGVWSEPLALAVIAAVLGVAAWARMRRMQVAG